MAYTAKDPPPPPTGFSVHKRNKKLVVWRRRRSRRRRRRRRKISLKTRAAQTVIQIDLNIKRTLSGAGWEVKKLKHGTLF